MNCQHFCKRNNVFGAIDAKSKEMSRYDTSSLMSNIKRDCGACS